MQYEYRCKECRIRWHELRKVIDRDQQVHCPSCQTTNVERLVSRPAQPQLRGDCWARDGYTKKSNK